MLAAIPSSSALPWVPVVRRRGRFGLGLQQVEQAAAARGLGLGPPVIISGRRRAGLQHLLGLVHTRSVGGVLLVSLDDLGLGSRTEETISLVAEIGSYVPLVVLEQDWVASLAPALAPVAAYLAKAVQRQRSAAGRTYVAVAKARGVKVGRPKKPVPVAAVELALNLGVGRASKLSGVPPTTLRRAVRARATSSAPCVMPVSEYFTTTANNREGHLAQHEAVAIAG